MSIILAIVMPLIAVLSMEWLTEVLFVTIFPKIRVSRDTLIQKGPYILAILILLEILEEIWLVDYFKNVATTVIALVIMFFSLFLFLGCLVNPDGLSSVIEKHLEKKISPE